jgi:putative methyltransferase (TIGR04325 family)
MRTRFLITRLLPPLIIDLLRRGSPFSRPAITWEGAYSHLRNVPTSNGFYDHEARVSDFVNHTRSLIALMHAGKKPNSSWHEDLGLLVASISANRDRTTVLDYGGGVGQAFVQLLCTVRCRPLIRYHVVDLERMCAAGRQLFANDSRIQFHTTAPALEGEIDIVYASSVLPYVEDYVALLRQLAAFKAPYILLTQLAVGRFPTFAARQLNLSGQVLAYWFLNLDEVIEVVVACGYSLVYDGQAGPEYDQRNYPKMYRIGRMHTLLFVRKNHASDLSSNVVREVDAKSVRRS